MVYNPLSQNSCARYAECQRCSEIIMADGDLMVAGVSGSGRRSLIRNAARLVGARVIEIDCLRATTSSRFLELLAERMLEVFSDEGELERIKQWSIDVPLELEKHSTYRTCLKWQNSASLEWIIFKALLSLPQVMAEELDSRVVFVFQNFPHIRSWDRSGEWEAYLRQEVDRQSRVNYVIIATIPEAWAHESNLQVITLAPLEREDQKSWVLDLMAAKGLKFEVDALNLFLDYTQGHLGDGSTLAHRIWLEYSLEQFHNARAGSYNNAIQLHHVHSSTLGVVKDLSQTFESLLLLLPPIQARVLESLASDPTDSPHAKQYVRKHQLSKGGGLQGALAGLEQKGLIYGAKYGYRVATPLLAFWLKHRLGF